MAEHSIGIDWSGGIASAISGVANLANGVLSYYGAKQQNKAQKEMQELEFAQNKEMWNMQNEYNDPKNQMARYRDAGLNPHLMYGSISAGNATNLPQYNAPNLNNPYSALGSGIADTGNAVASNLLNAKRLDSEIAVNKSIENKNNAEADFTRGAKTADTTAHSELTNQMTETEKARTNTELSKAISAEVHANVDVALQSVYIAIENQKLQNLTTEERRMLSEIAYKDMEKALSKEKISTEKFYRALENEKFKLEQKVADYNLKLDYLKAQNETDKVSIEEYRTNLYRLEMIQHAQEFIKTHNLDKDKFEESIRQADRNYKASRRDKIFDYVKFW